MAILSLIFFLQDVNDKGFEINFFFMKTLRNYRSCKFTVKELGSKYTIEDLSYDYTVGNLS